MISPYRLAGEMPPPPRPARVIAVEMEDDVESAVACRRLEDVEAEQPHDDGSLEYLCAALLVGLSVIVMVWLAMELTGR